LADVPEGDGRTVTDRDIAEAEAEYI